MDHAKGPAGLASSGAASRSGGASNSSSSRLGQLNDPTVGSAANNPVTITSPNVTPATAPSSNVTTPRATPSFPRPGGGSAALSPYSAGASPYRSAASFYGATGNPSASSGPLKGAAGGAGAGSASVSASPSVAERRAEIVAHHLRVAASLASAVSAIDDSAGSAVSADPPPLDLQSAAVRAEGQLPPGEIGGDLRVTVTNETGMNGAFKSETEAEAAERTDWDRSAEGDGRPDEAGNSDPKRTENKRIDSRRGNSGGGGGGGVGGGSGSGSGGQRRSGGSGDADAGETSRQNEGGRPPRSPEDGSGSRGRKKGSAKRYPVRRQLFSAGGRRAGAATGGNGGGDGAGGAGERGGRGARGSSAGQGEEWRAPQPWGRAGRAVRSVLRTWGWDTLFWRHEEQGQLLGGGRASGESGRAEDGAQEEEGGGGEGGGEGSGSGAGAGEWGRQYPQGAQGDPLESLDYDVIDNSVYREEQARRGKLHQMGYLIVKWVFALCLGIATGLAAFSINVAVEILAGWKFGATWWVMQRSHALAFVVYLAFNVLLVFSSSFIVTRFAPAAAGSGIPEIKGYLNGIDMPGILLVRTLVGKMLGSVGSVAGGLALGKEGPLVHTGACLAALIGQGGSSRYRIPFKWFRAFRNDRDRRDMVTCGAAAGAAAAFRAPVGGVLFALEEVTSWWRPQLMWRVFFTSAVVAVVLKACMRWCASGECGKFASGGFIIWDVHGGASEFFSYQLLPMTMLGLMGGLLGALFNQLTLYLSAWRRNYLHKRGDRVKIIEACLVAAATSALSFTIPFLAPCRACPDPMRYPDIVCPRPKYHWGNFVQFNCPRDDQYNDLATIFFNTQDDAIRNLFSSGTIQEYSATTLISFLLIFFCLAVLTYGIAVPSGQFVPGIMIGATYGRLVGMLMVHMYGQDNTDEGTYALLGAASFLGGSMRMTVSLCVIMVEITNNLNLLPLIMLVLLVSKAVGDGLNAGFYDLHAQLRGIPILEAQSQRFMRMLSARDAASTKVVYFARVEMVGRIAEVLRSTSHNGYPVLQDLPDGHTALAGLILRSQLLVLLRSKADFQQSPTERIHPLQTSSLRSLGSYSFSDFAKPVSTKGITIGDIELSREDLTLWIDLGPFLNPTPFIVDENMSLTKVHTLFRQLGLRHLCVVPPPSRAVGIITRKDLLPEILEERHAEFEDLTWEEGEIETFTPRLLRRGSSAAPQSPAQHLQQQQMEVQLREMGARAFKRGAAARRGE
ncbi:unnamed protein product [Closterium sp. Naga37s-1]|nr:unnamed protein product [Closterium sp. Naga37s-1]